MEIKSTINIILKDLEEAVNLIDDLKGYPGVPAIQVELAKAKCKSAGDVIKILVDTLKTEVKADEPTYISPAEEKIKVETSPSHTVLHNKIKTEESEDSETRRQKITTLIDEIVSTEHGEPLEQERKEEKSKKRGSKIVADSFTHLSSRINEQLGDQKREDNTGSKISKPVSNISQAIGVNDRFFFIREIFNGNQEKYSSVISEIDNAESYNSAVDVLKSNISLKLEDEPVQQLIEIVRRKFIHQKDE